MTKIMQEIEIWPFEELVYAQLGICPRKWDEKSFQGFLDKNGSPNLGQTTKPIDSQQKKKKKKKENKRTGRIWTLPSRQTTE